jgi:UDP-glucuronate 4-epimerase
MGSGPPRSASSPSTVRGSGRTWPFTPSPARWSTGKTLTLFGDGTQARDYTYCDDIVAGVLAAITWTAKAPVGVETFNLGGNRAIETEAMVAEIAAALGIKPKVEWAPMQPGDVQRTAADLTKSKAVLGYAPKTPFPEGIRRFVQWYRGAYGRAD